MTIRDALKRYSAIEADLLLARIFNQSREFLYVHSEKDLSLSQAKKFEAMARQRLQGMPMAYLLGYKDFYGLRFAVSRDVLIPRPESEWLVDRAVDEIKKRRGPLRILDMGTGSGCLVISVADALRHRKSLEYVASDISKKALVMAKKNAVKHYVKIKFIHSDLFNRVPGQFDIIIANLPYVPTKDYQKLKKDLRFEPKLALRDGGNSWKIYKKFLYQLPRHMNDTSIALLEIDPASPKFLKEHGERSETRNNITFFKDLGGRWRYAHIIKP